jgi:prepilin-type N-terminal cleavage/methylation domain-containing protein
MIESLWLRNTRRVAPRGFTLIELLAVIAIIAILGSTVMAAVGSARDKARFARARAELKEMEKALILYHDKYQTYPAEVERDVPPGIEEFMGAGGVGTEWPKGPWQGSTYDWENWDDPVTGAKIYQISLRFCPVGGPLSACSFPGMDWATGFDVNSALYYCIEGSCRAHIVEDVAYPGYCVNCVAP